MMQHEERLAGVHPDLVRIVRRVAAEGADFLVAEGLRTKERQAQLVKEGKSKTLNSRHLTGHAVDLWPVPTDWKDWNSFANLANKVKDAASQEGVAIEWGGDWKSFKDGPHYQLPWKDYP